MPDLHGVEMSLALFVYLFIIVTALVILWTLGMMARKEADWFEQKYPGHPSIKFLRAFASVTTWGYDLIEGAVGKLWEVKIKSIWKRNKKEQK